MQLQKKRQNVCLKVFDPWYLSWQLMYHISRLSPSAVIWVQIQTKPFTVCQRPSLYCLNLMQQTPKNIR